MIYLMSGKKPKRIMALWSAPSHRMLA